MSHRALVADRDPTTQHQVAALLRRAGISVETVESSERARARFVAVMPELVIVGESLSPSDGSELCRELRALSTRVRLVLVIDVPLPQDETEALKAAAGCDVILPRPLRIGELTEVLSGWGILAPEPPAEPAPLALGVPLRQPASGAPATPVAVPLPLPVPVPVPSAPLVATPTTETSAPKTPPVQAPPSPPLAPLPPTKPAELIAPPPAAAPADAPIPPAPASDPQWEGTVAPSPADTSPADTSPADTSPADTSPADTSPADTSPASLLPDGVPRFGDLATFPVPRLLYELYVGTYFGVVHLERQGTRRSVYFWAGVPVRVDTGQLGDSLGALLRAEGRITDKQLDAAKTAALEHGTAIGVALVRTGALHERDLLEALARQTERKLVSTFAWRDGRYVANEDTSFIHDTVVSDVRPMEVIWRGVCEHYETGALLQFFSQRRERYIVATDSFAVQAAVLNDRLEELEMSRWLDGRTTFEQALISDPARAVGIARALYVLLVTDSVESAEQPGDAAPPLAPPTPSSAALVDYPNLMAASGRIAREYVRIQGLDAFGVLELDRDADTATIERIYQAASSRLQHDRSLTGLSPEDENRARSVASEYTRAYECLIDPERRKVYLRSPRGKTSPDPSPADRTPPDEVNERRRALFAAEQAYEEGTALLAASEPHAARARFESAVKIHPGEAIYRVAVARAILAGGAQPAENGRAVAFGLIEDALRIDPASLPANLEAARLLIDEGTRSAARPYLERVLQRVPDHGVARRLLREI